MKKRNAIKQKPILSKPEEIHDQYDVNKGSISELTNFLSILHKKHQNKMRNTETASPNISDNNSIIWNHETLAEDCPMLNLNPSSDLEISDLENIEESFQSIKSMEILHISNYTQRSGVRKSPDEEYKKVDFSEDLDSINGDNSLKNIEINEENKSEEDLEFSPMNSGNGLELINIDEKYKNEDIEETNERIVTEDTVSHKITPIKSTEKQNEHRQIITSTQIDFVRPGIQKRRKSQEITQKGKRGKDYWKDTNPYISISSKKALEEIGFQNAERKRLKSKKSSTKVPWVNI